MKETSVALEKTRCMRLCNFVGFAIAFFFFHWFETWLDKKVGHDEDGDHMLAMVKDVESGYDKKKRKLRRNSDAMNTFNNSADDLARQSAGSDGTFRVGAVRRRKLDNDDDAYSSGSDTEGDVTRMPGASGSHKSRGKSARSSQKKWNRTVLLLSAITVHNFPEGMAVGVAFGAASSYVTFHDCFVCQ